MPLRRSADRGARLGAAPFFLLGMAGLGVLFLVSSLRVGVWSGGRAGVGLFPALAAALLLAMSLVALLRNLRGGPPDGGDPAATTMGAPPEETAVADAPRDEGVASAPAEGAADTVPWRIPVIVAFLLSYGVLSGLVGHVPSASLVAAGVIKLVAPSRPWWFILATALAIGVATLVLFQRILGLPIPGR